MLLNLENTSNESSVGYIRDPYRYGYNYYWYPYYGIPVKLETYTLTCGSCGLLNFEDKGDYFQEVIELPGYDKSSIKIEVEDTQIKLSAHRTRDNKEFSVSSTLPQNSGEVSAKFDNGELVIKVEKLNKKKLVQIE